MPSFDHGNLTIHYSERGDPAGPPVVLIHGLLWSSRMMRRIADYLPDHRMLLIDLRGHGPSSRPTAAEFYSWDTLASDVIALLDHLEIDRAVIGGLSLGANVTLAAGNTWPDRVAGMIVEMPVLDRGAPFARPVFGGLANVLATTAPVLGPVTRRVAGLPMPKSIPDLAALRDVLALEPKSSAALLRGLLADQLFLADLDATRLTMPTLVIGHRGDPLHVLDDARDLVALLPDARLDVRHTIADYRVRPGLLAKVLLEFLERVPARA